MFLSGVDVLLLPAVAGHLARPCRAGSRRRCRGTQEKDSTSVAPEAMKIARRIERDDDAELQDVLAVPTGTAIARR
jgi:hypothetical protein